MIEKNFEEISISMIKNVKYSIESSVEYLYRLSTDMDDVSDYRMFILCLHSGLELLFKYMISNRNEYMLYINNNKNELHNLYKKAREDGYRKITYYIEDNPSESKFHTLSFLDSCNILHYAFDISNFNDSYLKRCIFLNNVRNRLTHHTANIRKFDIISFCDLLKQAIVWFNEDLDYYEKENFREISREDLISEVAIQPASELYKIENNNELYKTIHKVRIETIKNELLENDLCKKIIGFILNNSTNINFLDLEIKHYEEIKEMFLNNLDDEIPKDKKKEISREFDEKYHIMNLANIFIDEGIKSMEHDDAPIVMTIITISEFARELIISKWCKKEDIIHNLNINNESYHNAFEKHYDYDNYF